MKKFLPYIWWATEVCLLRVILGFDWAMGFIILSLGVELIYYIINKYFKSLIDMFGSSMLRSLTFVIKDYKKFWLNFVTRIVMYITGLMFAILFTRLI